MTPPDPPRGDAPLAAEPGTPVRYRFEADMLPALERAVDDLVAGLPDAVDRAVMFEVPAFESVPDLVAAQLDHAAAQRRHNAGGAPVTDASAVRTLLALAAGTRGLDDLATRVGISRAHLRRSVLPGLAEAGWTAPLASRDREVEVLRGYEPLARWVVTVEAKRTKWREAVAQARRHLRVADRAYIALDAAHIGPAAAFSEDLAADGIGLISVAAPTDTATVLQHPKPGPGPDRVAQAQLGERLWRMQLDGQRVGPAVPVFGRILPTPIADP